MSIDTSTCAIYIVTIKIHSSVKKIFLIQNQIKFNNQRVYSAQPYEL